MHAFQAGVSLAKSLLRESENASLAKQMSVGALDHGTLSNSGKSLTSYDFEIMTTH